MGVSQREFADLWGKSRGAVQKAIASGRITLEKDGSINPEKALASLKENTDPSQVRGKKRVTKAAAMQTVRETLQESGHPIAGGGANFVQARTANEVLKAQERKLRVQKLKGELIDRTQATAFVYQLARQERDAWQMWPTRVAATLAAEIGADTHRVQIALEKLVREHLTQLADIKVDLRS